MATAHCSESPSARAHHCRQNGRICNIAERHAYTLAIEKMRQEAFQGASTVSNKETAAASKASHQTSARHQSLASNLLGRFWKVAKPFDCAHCLASSSPVEMDFSSAGNLQPNVLPRLCGSLSVFRLGISWHAGRFAGAAHCIKLPWQRQGTKPSPTAYIQADTKEQQRASCWQHQLLQPKPDMPAVPVAVALGLEFAAAITFHMASILGKQVQPCELVTLTDLKSQANHDLWRCSPWKRCSKAQLMLW